MWYLMPNLASRSGQIGTALVSPSQPALNQTTRPTASVRLPGKAMA